MSHQPSSGFIGIAHTRWATHGKPSEADTEVAVHTIHKHLARYDLLKRITSINYP